MKTNLSEEEKQKVAEFCRNNPWKALATWQEIANFLQLRSVKQYQNETGIPERTIYNNAREDGPGKIAYTELCGQKLIIKAFN
ncbi:MAG: hypothetical protein JXA03_15455 [Bacteroidales bacterium]|nr:hypothetical protein [Bacteroidales bacterium]